MNTEIKNILEKNHYSQILDLGLPENKELGIGFINGVYNSFEQTIGHAQMISSLAGGYNVHAVFNDTQGAFSKIGQVILGFGYVPTEPVKLLWKLWDDFFENGSETSRFLMFSHSEGALHVRNALKEYPAQYRDRIIVVAIAPAAYISKDTCSAIFHYRAKPWRDIVPRGDVFGGSAWKNTVVDVESHPDAPHFDHSFRSPTYKHILQFHVSQFLGDKLPDLGLETAVSA